MTPLNVLHPADGRYKSSALPLACNVRNTAWVAARTTTITPTRRCRA